MHESLPEALIFPDNSGAKCTTTRSDTIASRYHTDGTIRADRPPQQDNRQLAAQPRPSRASRWSPTRMALAIAVRAGLTALMLGKKLVSTT